MKSVDKLLDTKIELFGLSLRVVDVLFFSVMLGLGISMRLSLFDIKSGDYTMFLKKWMKECRDAGGFGYLSIEPLVTDKSTINYGCMYQYVIVILYYLRGLMSDFYLIKIPSVIFDIVCAVTIMRIAFEVTGQNTVKAIMAFGISLLLPTVVLNSAAWAQCDSIYTAFALLSILHMLKGNDRKMFIYLALSYSFKQQAIFLLPLIIIMWLKGRVKLRYILYCPVVLFLTIIPALFAGRNMGELLSVYIRQVSTYTRLTLNYPSIYSVVAAGLREDYRKMIIASGTIATVALLGVLAYYIRNKKFKLTDLYIVTLAIFTIELCLFVLPVMHERYGYLPEILSVVYGLTRYRRMLLCGAFQVISVITYSRFLFGSEVENIWPLSLCIFATIAVLGYDLYLQMSDKEVKSVRA